MSTEITSTRVRSELAGLRRQLTTHEDVPVVRDGATYHQRLEGAFARPGFEIVAARDEPGRAIGSAHGVTLPEGIAWWQTAKDTAPRSLADAAGAGSVFWLRELMVRESHRGKGLGRKLHDELAGARSEDYLAMTVMLGNEPARTAYLHWGYRIFARVRHADDSPEYEAMYRQRS